MLWVMRIVGALLGTLIVLVVESVFLDAGYLRTQVPGMLIAFVPILVFLAGLLMFILSANPKVVRIGEILMFVGAFFTVQALAGHTVRLLQ